MPKLFANLFNKEKDTYPIPKTVQQSIPIDCIASDGIWHCSNRYTKTYRFSDINYRVAGREEQEEMFLEYCSALNLLEVGMISKISIINRRIQDSDVDGVAMPLHHDELDSYRRECNGILLEKARGGSGIRQEKYITQSIAKNSFKEARTAFSRSYADISQQFARLGSSLIELDSRERLKILRDFYRNPDEGEFVFDIKDSLKKGASFKDAIAPDSIRFKSNYFEFDGKFGRALFLKNYPTFLKDSMVSELTDLPRQLALSIDILPIATDKAVSELQRKILGVETNVANYQRSQNARDNFAAIIPIEMEQARKETREFLDDLTNRDQRMMIVTVTLVHLADSLDELNADTEALLTTARKHLCDFSVLHYQQEAGLNTALPIGLQKINAKRTLTTESTAVLLPFTAQDIFHEGGLYYGINRVSKNMILCNRDSLQNGNGYILGVSGSGKSFAAKQEITYIALSRPDDEILVIDPEMEYAPLIQALGGEVIKISANNNVHINAMEIGSDYEESESPISMKSDFILSLCEQLMGTKVEAKQKSLIDRCTANALREYIEKGYQGTAPTLKEFHAELMRQPEREAKDVALAIELYVNGSLNIFAHQTNVDIQNRIVCYDILDLGKQLKAVGMLVILDAIFNRITRNRQRGIRTWLFIDEIYLMFNNEYSANYLYELWKRVCKYNAKCTGITQNISDLLQSHTACTMLANSEFLLMLNQAPTDRAELAAVLNISDAQMSYVTNAPSGHGLIKSGGAIVPFENKFPTDNNSLYRLMSTRPGEAVIE